MTENYGILIKVKGTKPAKVSLRKSTSALLPLLVCLLGVSGFCWWSERDSRTRPAMMQATSAEYRMGKRLFGSAHSSEDYRRAAACIARAAKQGDPKAQTALAMLCLKGFGVERDQQAGIAWLRKAAGREYSIAENELGVLYATGKGLPQDLNQAIHWCRLAADQGYRGAQCNLTLLEAAKESLQATMSDLAHTNYEKVAIQRCDSDGIMVKFEPGKGGIGLAKVKTDELSGPLHQLCSLLTEKAGLQTWTLFLQKPVGPALGTL